KGGLAGLSPDGSLYAVATEGGIDLITCADDQKKQSITSRMGRGSISWAVAEDRPWLAFEADKGICVADFKTGTTLLELPLESTYSGTKLAFSPDGRSLAVALDYRERDGAQALLWDLDSGQIRVVLQIPRRARPRTLAFSPDGRFLAMSNEWMMVVHDVVT